MFKCSSVSICRNWKGATHCCLQHFHIKNFKLQNQDKEIKRKFYSNYQNPASTMTRPNRNIQPFKSWIKNRIQPSRHENHESRTGSGHPGIQIKELSNPNPREKGKEEDGDEITGEKASEGDERWMINCGVAAAAMPHCWFAAQPLSAARCCAAPSSSPTRTGAEKICKVDYLVQISIHQTEQHKNKLNWTNSKVNNRKMYNYLY